MSVSAPANGFSADVKLQLIVNGRVLKLAQVGPDFVIIDEPQELPPCPADVAVCIDGRESRRSVRLVDGTTTASRVVRIVSR